MYSASDLCARLTGMTGMIGQRVLRREDSRFLRGGGSYVESLDLPHARHITFVRSLFAHARIVEVDVSAVRAVPSAEVFVAADLDLGTFDPPPFPGLDRRMGRPFLAHDVVRFAGEIVAIVVTDESGGRNRRR